MRILEIIVESNNHNFTAADIKQLEAMTNVEDARAKALSLISKKSKYPMHPDKIRWFSNQLKLKSTVQSIVKMMYDLMLSGEGNAVVGTRFSTKNNDYRTQFKEAAYDYYSEQEILDSVARFINCMDDNDMPAALVYLDDIGSRLNDIQLGSEISDVVNDIAAIREMINKNKYELLEAMASYEMDNPGTSDQIVAALHAMDITWPELDHVLSNIRETSDNVVRHAFGTKQAQKNKTPYHYDADIAAEIPRYDSVKRRNIPARFELDNPNAVPYDRFEVKKVNDKIAHIIGVAPDGGRVQFSTTSVELAIALADAYNRGGFTDADIQRVTFDEHANYDINYLAEYYSSEYDDEAGMAHSNLHTISRAAHGLLSTIDRNANLPEWAQEKIAKVEGMLVSIWDYLKSQKEQGIHPTVDESSAWQRSAGKSKSGGLNAKGVASYRREHPGSKLQTAVTTKPSKLKAGSKDAKRRKSFCARMSGVKGPMKKPNGDPTRKALALKKWNCESVEQSVHILETVHTTLLELKQRLDPKCWTGYKKQGTKVKGNIKVNNCIPVKESKIYSDDDYPDDDVPEEIAYMHMQNLISQLRQGDVKFVVGIMDCLGTVYQKDGVYLPTVIEQYHKNLRGINRVYDMLNHYKPEILEIIVNMLLDGKTSADRISDMITVFDVFNIEWPELHDIEAELA